MVGQDDMLNPDGLPRRDEMTCETGFDDHACPYLLLPGNHAVNASAVISVCSHLRGFNAPTDHCYSCVYTW